MKSTKNIFQRFRKSMTGQGLVEYALILALISVISIGALGGIGDGIKDVFDKVVGAVDSNVQEDGDGVDELITAGYIPIANGNELNNLRKNENQTFGLGTKWEGTYTSGLDKNYIQVDNIDLVNFVNFEPIGELAPYYFKGSFDGGGYTISNLNIDRPTERHVGLFRNGFSAKFENISLVNIDVKGMEDVGGLVGWQGKSSEVINCYSTGKVTGNLYIGGLVGIQTDNSNIINSHSSATVNGYITGNMTGNGGHIGGLIASQNSGSQVIQSYATGNVTGRNQVGGLIGRAGDSTFVINSYATGDVAQDNFMIYASGGGLVGHTMAATITNSYSTGKVVGTSEDVGGLIGDQYNSTITNSYYDTETSAQATSAGGVGKSTADMKKQSTYTNWDFDTIWKIESGKYPTLQ